MGRDKEKQAHFDMQFFTATISTTLVLLLLGVVMFFVLSARNLSRYVKENVNFSIVLSDDMKEKDILDMKDRLEQQPFVRQIEFISKKQALQEQTQAMGTNPEDFLGYNPFQASLEVKLKENYANTDSIAKIEQQLKLNVNVQEVLYQESLIDAVNRNIRNISLVLLLAAGLLLVISFALINSTIRLMLYAQRFLIYTMKLVGASWKFIRRPFMRKNFRMGLLSGILTDVILLALTLFLMNMDSDLSEIFTFSTMLTVMVMVIVLGIVIAMGCAYFSVNKFLKMKLDRLYNI